MDNLLTPKEITQIYEITPSRLQDLVDTGKVVEHRTTGRHRRFEKSEFDAIFKAKSERPNITELGSTDVNGWHRYDYEEQLTPLKGRAGLKLYREMRLNDPVIAAVFFALGNALRQANWRVKAVSDKPADVAVAEFVESCQKDLSWSWTSQVTFIVDPLFEQGHSLLEKVYKYRRGEPGSLYDDNRIGWRKWAPRPAETLVEGDEWKYDENGGVLGANQEVEGKPNIFLPIEKCLLFRTTVHPANIASGVPIHRSSYTSWYYSQNIAEIEGIGIERDLAGIPIVYLGTDCTMSGTNSEFELAKKLVTNIRNDEQAGVVIPKPKMGTGANPGEGMLLELLNTGGSREFDTTRIIERYDKRKAVAVLAQFILLGMDRVGSFALSKNQSDLFVLAAKAWLDDIAAIINRHAIPELIRYNVFPGRTGYPELIPGELGIPDLTTTADYVNKLVGANVLVPDAELERHLRQIGGLPAPSVEIRPEQKKPELTKPTEEKPDEEETETVKIAKSLAKQKQAQADKRVEELWGDFATKVEAIPQDREDRDMLIAALLLALSFDLERVIQDNSLILWESLHGTEGIETVEEVVQQAMVYFNNFSQQIQLDLRHGRQIVRQVLESYRARFLMYSGEIWKLWNLAKVWGADPYSLWEWVGPGDEKSCMDCLEEIAAGIRPLWQISRRPGSVQCLSNDRCELVQRKAKG